MDRKIIKFEPPIKPNHSHVNKNEGCECKGFHNKACFAWHCISTDEFISLWSYFQNAILEEVDVSFYDLDLEGVDPFMVWDIRGIDHCFLNEHGKFRSVTLWLSNELVNS